MAHYSFAKSFDTEYDGINNIVNPHSDIDIVKCKTTYYNEDPRYITWKIIKEAYVPAITIRNQIQDCKE